MADGKYGMPRRTHRIAWETANGRKMADDALACHSCDTRLCNNPNHIFEGSYKDNTQDMMSKGRNRHNPSPKRGHENPASKLNDAMTAGILRDNRAYTDIAKHYGVSTSIISSIKRGKIWSHVPGDRVDAMDEAGITAKRRKKTAKVTEDQVRAIRADARSYTEISKEHGICIATISSIKNRKTWADIK